MHRHPELPQAFAQLGVEIRFLQALHKMKFVEPSEIQRAMIPVALSGRDIIGQARTGTGKTAAFSLPVLQMINPEGRLQALCLAPTRELAVQIAGEVTRLAGFAQLHIAAIYGGQKIQKQLHDLGRKPHFVVGTPGRVIDFMNRRALDVSGVRFVILDEVDRMLDIGFRDDIRYILGRLPQDRQTIFVSATIEGEVRKLARQFTRKPEEINVSRDEMTVETVEQSYVSVEGHDKFRLLRLMLQNENPPIAIIFCNTKHGARKLAKKLHEAGVEAKEIHGDLMQRQRDKVMEWFRKHRIKVLVATDLAARGIDVSSITHIINYDLPDDPEIYVHRIGRTARMGAQGVAISFVTREQGKELTRIEMLINKAIPVRQVPGFSPTPASEQAHPAPARATPATSRYQQPVHVGADNAAPPPPKTLGGKFKPSRRRRL